MLSRQTILARRLSGFWCLLVLALFSSFGLVKAEDRVPYSTIAQIKENPIPGHPVQLQATVTFANALWSVIFVQDDTDAIYVAAHWERNPLPESILPGTLLEIGGIVAGGEADSIIAEAACRIVGPGEKPEPLTFDLAEHDFADYDAHWVTTTARIVDVVHSGVHLLASTESGGQRLWLHLPPHDDEDSTFFDTLPGSLVQVTGTLGINLGRKGKVLGPLLYLADESQMQILEKANDGPKVDDLGLLGWSQSSPDSLSLLTFKLSGQVTHVKENDLFYLENRGRVARVSSGSCQILSEGEFVEVIGVVQSNRAGYVAVEAQQVHKTHYRPLAEPVRIHTVAEIHSKGPDGQFISVQGKLEDLKSEGMEHKLSLSQGDHVFNVRFVASVEEMAELRIADTKQLQFSGVCDFSKENGTFTLHVSSVEHVHVLSRPTEVGFLVALIALALVGFIAFAYAVWAAQLRQKVDARTKSLTEITARLRSTNEATNDAILVGSPEGAVLEVNQHMKELFGIEISAGDLISEIRTKMEACLDTSGDRFQEDWECLYKPVGESAMTLRLESPSRREISVFTAPVLSAEGEVYGRLWTFQDRTEQMELQESLTQSQKMEAVGRLAGGIAHDFNNLLTGVIGNLSVAQLDSGKTVAECRESLRSAESAAYRASELVKQLLGFSRKTALEMKVCDVNIVISRMRDLLVHSFDSNIDLELDLAAELWNTKLDGNHLEQVLLNLCVNARDAINGESGGIIKIGTTNMIDPEDQECVQIRVQDTGMGMEADVLDKIFEPFFTTKEQGKGTGLGLAMSYGIIEQHGGRIECDSEPGVGTEFLITLPRSLEEVTIPEEEIESSFVPSSEGQARKILFIDDEFFVRAVGEGILKHHGYSVICATNGREGMDLLETRANEIDLIITDLTMPVMSGKEVFKEVRRLYPKIPVLVSSGYTVDPDTFTAETGSRPDAFVSKPFAMEDMLRNVESCLNKGAAGLIAA